jgi:hypothetical protein
VAKRYIYGNTLESSPLRRFISQLAAHSFYYDRARIKAFENLFKDYPEFNLDVMGHLAESASSIRNPRMAKTGTFHERAPRKIIL